MFEFKSWRGFTLKCANHLVIHYILQSSYFLITTKMSTLSAHLNYLAGQSVVKQDKRRILHHCSNLYRSRFVNFLIAITLACSVSFNWIHFSLSKELLFCSLRILFVLALLFFLLDAHSKEIPVSLSSLASFHISMDFSVAWWMLLLLVNSITCCSRVCTIFSLLVTNWASSQHLMSGLSPVITSSSGHNHPPSITGDQFFDPFVWL